MMGGTDGHVTWLMLIYRVPSEPTRLRAAVWRKLRSLGAVYVQNSAAVAPRTPQSERMLRALRNEIIESMHGQAFLISTSSVLGEADLVALYNAARDDEYEEILDKCEDFHAGVEKEVVAQHFTYGELEENEEDLAKLKGWYEKVKARDVLGAKRAAEVAKAIEDCSKVLEEFAARVYEAEDSAIF
ncbi:Chromate resistance protein ChrB [Nonomuraea sp. NPDC049649]|uniref:Chromate resistance protein ChrB n=1 Tax=Nonomuraea sp. NPDC049649 TaxID=3155776 RepID=UPI003417D2EE